MGSRVFLTAEDKKFLRSWKKKSKEFELMRRRLKEWKEKMKAKKEYGKAICPNCNDEFIKSLEWQKFCCGSCNQKYRYARRLCHLVSPPKNPNKTPSVVPECEHLGSQNVFSKCVRD